MSVLVMAAAISFRCSVRRLFSSEWFHERSVSSKINISHACGLTPQVRMDFCSTKGAPSAHWSEQHSSHTTGALGLPRACFTSYTCMRLQALHNIKRFNSFSRVSEVFAPLQTAQAPLR